ATIVRRSAGILQIELDERGAVAIAARSRGTPRVANRLLKRVRDFAEVRMEGIVTAHAAQAALEMLEVDELGLDRLDREILRTTPATTSSARRAPITGGLRPVACVLCTSPWHTPSSAPTAVTVRARSTATSASRVSPRAAPSAASRFSSNCSTTTTLRRTPPS